MAWNTNSEKKDELNWPFYIQETIRLRRDAEAAGDPDKAFNLFEEALRSCVPYLLPTIRKAMEEDYAKFEKARADITGSGLSENEKREMMLAEKQRFFESHIYYVMQVLSKANVAPNADDARVDFKELDFEGMKEIVRSRKAFDKSVSGVVEDGDS